MDTVDFLRRIIPAEDRIFISIGPSPNSQPPAAGEEPLRFHDASFDAGKYRSAAWVLQTEAARGHEVYFACGGFKPKVDGKTSRHHGNVANVKAFWIDCDVLSPGSNKKPGEVFADQREALKWLLEFETAISLPHFNMLVKSGYGLHAYWVFDEPVAKDVWQPYADAMEAAMRGHGFPSETGITGDASRILRPPNTFNQKVKDDPVPVSVVEQATGPDHKFQDLADALLPFVGKLPRSSPKSNTSANTAGKLAGGSKAAAAATGPNMNAAAQAGLPDRPARLFRLIADECLQVKQSLAEHGEHDSRATWLLGHLTLAHFCTDGEQWVHALGDGHPTYDKDATDAEVERIKAEHAVKDMGPPTCAFYDRSKPGVCGGCPHNGKAHSPWELGVDAAARAAVQATDVHTALPFGFYRESDPMRIEMEVPAKDEDDEITRLRVVAGDITDFLVFKHQQGGFMFSFLYRHQHEGERQIYGDLQMLKADKHVVYQLFQQQSLVLSDGTEGIFRRLILAWVDKVREANRVIHNPVQPFGWHLDQQGRYEGFALSGTLYHKDGTEQPTMAVDRQIAEMFSPRGTLKPWQDAFDFVCTNRPELQTLVAASFGAPLMRFTGHSGVALSAWSRASGVGKTSALSIAQAVWSSQSAKNALDDTSNSVLGRVARLRAMMCAWDEPRPSTPDEVKAFVKMVFAITQGKEKSRMQADRTQSFVGEYETLLLIGSNQPLMEAAMAETPGTDAGAVRIFEYHISAPPMSPSARANQIVGAVKDNYGHAGIAYAKYIARNARAIENMVVQVTDKIIRDTQSSANERFYAAAIGSMIVGASVANKIGLANFDVNALYTFLFRTMIGLRTQRSKDVGVNDAIDPDKFDLHEVLSRFLNFANAGKLITDSFGAPGTGSKPAVFYAPSNPGALIVHHAYNQHTLRISRHHFLDWARKHRLAGTAIIGQMVAQWGAAERRAVMGAGTVMSTGRTQCFDIDTNHPALSHLQNIFPKSALDNAPPLKLVP